MTVEIEFDQIRYLMKMTRKLVWFAYLPLEFIMMDTCTVLITRYSKLKKERTCRLVLRHALFDRVYEIFA